MFFTIFKPEDFYKNFDTDFFLFAQEISRANLENKNLFTSIKEKFNWVEEDSYRVSIKMQIRFMNLLCINTLFELIFNLLPDNDGYIPDKEVILRMNRFKELKPFEISNWVNGRKSVLDKLLDTITYKNNEINEVIYHLFYLGQPRTEEVISSVKILIQMLKEMGREISDTSELNSFKHGMRGVIDPRYFKILNNDTGMDLLKFDFKESVSYFTYHNKEKCFSINYSALDSDRDYTLTFFASMFIKSIVTPRKKLFHKNEKKEEIVKFFFTEEHLEKVVSHNKPYSFLKFSNCKNPK